VVRPASILILEPTAALDPETEAALVRAVRARPRSHRWWPHRLRPWRGRQILGGRIVERGTHAALLARPDGAYRFWELTTGATRRAGCLPRCSAAAFPGAARRQVVHDLDPCSPWRSGRRSTCR
jgi:hypothetical protein